MTSARRATLLDAADSLALLASAACVVHCLALPLLFAALPALSQVLRLPESLHLWMVAVAIPTSASALLAGTRGQSSRPILVGFIGLGLLAIGTTIAGETRYELPITIVGALILSTAHILNWRRRHNGTPT